MRLGRVYDVMSLLAMCGVGSFLGEGPWLDPPKRIRHLSTGHSKGPELRELTMYLVVVVVVAAAAAAAAGVVVVVVVGLFVLGWGCGGRGVRS